MEGARLADREPVVLGLIQRAGTVSPCISCLEESEDTHDLLVDKRCADDGPLQGSFFLQELIFAHCELLAPPTIRGNSMSKAVCAQEEGLRPAYVSTMEVATS